MPTVLPVAHPFSGLRRLDPRAADWTLVLALVLWAQLDLWAFGGTLTNVRGSHGLAAPFLVLFALPLVWRRRRPLAVLCAVMGAVALEAVVLGAPVQGVDLLLPMLIAVYSVAAYAELRPALIGFGVGFVGMLVVLLFEPEVVTFGDLVVIEGTFFVALGGAAWLAGRFVRARRIDAERFERRAELAERGRDQHTRAALADERGRIARELHDVIAHSVSLMGVQAGAVERVLERDPERAREALRSIQVTARESVGELRRLLGMLRSDDGPTALSPQPSLDSLESLIEDNRLAGLEVDLTIEGPGRQLPPGVELSAYRVLQEALTNVRKHAPAGAARVRLIYDSSQLELQVDNDAVGGAPVGPGTGHGILGMSERVALYGGSLDARPRPDGGFSVRARLPIEVQP
jgi:signal transduction histidine kinase